MCILKLEENLYCKTFLFLGPNSLKALEMRSNDSSQGPSTFSCSFSIDKSFLTKKIPFSVVPDSAMDDTRSIADRLHKNIKILVNIHLIGAERRHEWY